MIMEYQIKIISVDISFSNLIFIACNTIYDFFSLIKKFCEIMYLISIFVISAQIHNDHVYVISCH